MSSKSQFGIVGILRDYQIRLLWKGSKLAIILSLVLHICLYLLDVDFFTVFKNSINLALEIIPDILGFVLGGYAILIGFGNPKFLLWMSKDDQVKKPSLYKKISSVFAFSLLSQLVVLFLAIISNYFIELETPYALKFGTANMFNGILSV